MTDLKLETINILNKFHIKPKKYLSQNFVINSSLNKIHLKNLDLKEDDEVIEIGGGIGFLTQDIAKHVKKVMTIEIDKKLIRILENKLSTYSNIDIIEGDVLELDSNVFKNKKIVSNTPYSISSPLLFKILESQDFNLASLTFQKEFARRLIAKPATRKYGRISVTSRIFGEITLIEYIPKNYFYPIPKVDSAVVKILPHLRVNPEDLNLSLKIIKEIFNYRNKILKNGLRYFFKKEKIEVDMNELEERYYQFLNRKIITLSLEELVQFIKEIKNLI
ncbi:MAG: 16S rRNA (adenine(1518)-N(6)/adenine(1519)-N(6))-dimethyltransferase RsmA [Candidatus Helarchaeota archaeon]